MSAGGAQAALSRMANVLSECIEHCSMPASSTLQSQPQVDAEGRVVLVACAGSVEDVAAPLRRCFTHEIGLEPADQDARLALLQASITSAPWTLCRCGQLLMHIPRHAWLMSPVSCISQGSVRCNDSLQPKLVDTLKDVAAQTAGLLPIDLTAILADAAASAATRHIGLEDVCKDPPQGSLKSAPCTRDAALQINANDFDRALGNMRQRTAISIGAPQVCSCRGCHSTSLHLHQWVPLLWSNPERCVPHAAGT